MDSVSRQITVYRDGTFHREEREIVEEFSYRLIVNGEQAGQLSCSPWGIRQAAIGALFMRGVIAAYEDIRTLDIDDAAGSIRVSTASTAISQTSAHTSAPLSPDEVLLLADALDKRSRLFRRTGGVHCAALAQGSEVLAFEEDVSRHAAVDKLAGYCLAHHIRMDGGILVFSGRVPGEILRKAAMMGCRMIIAVSAPTDRACRLAEELGITLIGFARDNTFNIYTCPERITAT